MFLQQFIIHIKNQPKTFKTSPLATQSCTDTLFSFFLHIFCRNPLGCKRSPITHSAWRWWLWPVCFLNCICATAQAKLEVSSKYAPSACAKMPWQPMEPNSNNSQVETIEYTSGPMATCNHTWQSFKPVSFKNAKSPFWQEPAGDSLASKQVVMSVCSWILKCVATNCYSNFVGLHAVAGLAFCEKTSGFCTALTSWHIASDITGFSKAMVLLMLVQYPGVSPKQISVNPKQTNQKPRNCCTKKWHQKKTHKHIDSIPFETQSLLIILCFPSCAKQDGNSLCLAKCWGTWRAQWNLVCVWPL